MKKGKKPFDAVKMMREIRDKLSLQFQEMSFEEQRQYMRERLRAKAKPRRAGNRTQTT
jgi:pyruvate kinase